MDNAQLIGLSQQTALRRQLDIVANNLANLSTPGFRAERAVFEEFVIPIAEDGTQTGTAANVSFVSDVALFRDFRAGEIEVTGNPLDVAIDGEGWIAVQTADGERYTRSGRFSLDPDGRLVTMDGDQVLGEGGPVTFDDGETDITFAIDGTIASSQGIKDRLRVVTFENERALVKEGGRLFSSPDAPAPLARVRLVQGAVEQSNVNAVEEITQMIQVTRAYESTARMLSRLGELQRNAIETLGTVPTN